MIAPDIASILVALGLMAFFVIFGFVMSQMPALACPWEGEPQPEPQPQRDYERLSRTEWRTPATAP